MAAEQRTCPITEQGEQAKASMEQNQASLVASVQPCRRGEEKRSKRCSRDAQRDASSTSKPHQTGSCTSRLSHAARDKGTRPASAETGPKLKQQEEAKLFSCFCFDQP